MISARYVGSTNVRFQKVMIEAFEIGKKYSGYLGIKPKLEYPIHEVKRIANIVFEFPNSWFDGLIPACYVRYRHHRKLAG
ncbi:hypothetical protein [Sedimenticola hydrogenitrophicus]|uniref:hypothetical protein n=1 Tax=Sedimenticola hydrogenitrophicus TaxID=2967975 RepID=UPI0023B1CCD9|nr:hypothetical protein [Sedimenticola hydrogenitrophicus]